MNYIRSQLYSYSKKRPICLLKDWLETGHPFLEKYAKKGYFDLNELFWNNCEFVNSHEHFQIRIADIVCSILSRRYNNKNCISTYNLLKTCFLERRKIHHVILNPVDFNYQLGQQTKNPWENIGNRKIFL